MNSELIRQIMVERGMLSGEQVAQAIEQQARPPYRQHFAEAAAQLFGVDEIAVLDALATQAQRQACFVHLPEETLDPAVLKVISPRDAWDQLILPLRPDSRGRLLCATTVETLPAAIAFLQSRLERPFILVLTEIRLLEQYIAEQYQFEGVDLGEEAA